ncbi:unnamed protein product [Symbiodinium sp. CCMP2592]|nr:unnamed protein product [Symbiodinium sp. CCMP2592]
MWSYSSYKELWARDLPAVEWSRPNIEGFVLTTMGERLFSELAAGDLCDLVVCIIRSDMHGATMRTLWHSEICKCAGSFETGQTLTLYAAQHQGHYDGVHHLQLLSGTRVLVRPPLGGQSFRTLKEVCAGIGGQAQGCRELGGNCLAVSDWSALACDTLALQHATVVQGDITDPAVRRSVHSASAETRCLLGASLPGPGSSRGLSSGSSVWECPLLPHILHLAWFSQASGLVLESEVNILQHSSCLSQITAFAAKAGFQVSQVVIELAHQWASRRARWWAVLLPAHLPAFELRSNDGPFLGKCFQAVPLWLHSTTLLQMRHLHPQALGAYQARLLHARLDSWITPAILAGGHISVQTEEALWEPNIVGPTTVQQLLQEAKAKLAPGLRITLSAEDRCLPFHALVHPAPSGPVYKLVVKPKHASRDALPAQQPTNQCAEPSSPACALIPLAVHLAPQGTTSCTDIALWCGLWDTARTLGTDSVLILPPKIAITLLELSEDCSRVLRGQPSLEWPPHMLVFAPFVAAGHWTLLVLSQGSHEQPQVLAEVFDGIPGRNTTPARKLANILCALAGRTVHNFVELSFWLQTEQNNCGALALAHAASRLSGSPDPLHLQNALDFLASFPPLPSHIFGDGGLSAEQERELHALLVSKGVPATAVEARLQQALLKAAGSKPGALFKWVQPEELAAHIEQRAQEKFGTEVPRAKAKKQKAARKPVHAPLHEDPSQLQLSPASFASSSGAPLGQLQFEEVQSQATGICFASLEQVAPFLRSSTNLSVDALALVTTSEIALESAGLARVSSVRYPAIFAPTQEAILVSGSLVQLGDEDVQIAATDIAEVDHLSTCVCRLSLFRDECKLSWDSIAEAPIRVLLQQVPELQVCRNPSCDQSCPAFHAAVDEVVDHLFLDVWARQWCRLSGGKIKAAEAELFQAFIRVPSSAIPHLFRVSLPGLYIEPRAADGSGPHASWAVVWLPGTSAAQALHLLKTTSKAVALARLGVKYGLRTKEADEQTVFEALRPNHHFVKVRVVARFRLHPLPHGFQRHNLLLLKQWGWNCKPLQPDRGDALGCAWLVGAADEPPAQALPLGTSFVLATKVRDFNASRTAPSAVCASARTRKALLIDDDGDDGTAADPWSGGRDPWSQARPSTAIAAPPAGSSSETTKKLSQIEDGLRQDLHTMLQKTLDEREAPPGLSEQDKRLHSLETTVSELRHQGAKFESWFQGFGTKVADQAQQLTELQTTVKEQQAELGRVKSDVQQTVHQVVGALQSELTSQMASQLAGQMEQIQELFASKKPRLGLGRTSRSSGRKNGLGMHSRPTLGCASLTLVHLCRFVFQVPCGLLLALSCVLGCQTAAACHTISSTTVRYGEAEHPGPSSVPPFFISTSNPSGLRAKEPHYTATGRSAHVLSGAPAALRVNSQWAGTWTGVLQVSDLPCRPLNPNWPLGVFETGRIMLAQHYHESTPLLVATVYGYPSGPTWPDSKSRTDNLLSTLTKEVVLGSRGFRVICGDFNQDLESLQQCTLWRAQGWIEAQDLAQQLWNQAPVMTCKHATRRDFIWLSPEAASQCTQVLASEVFQEHTTLLAGFSLPQVPAAQTTWPLPAELPWSEVQLDAWHRSGNHHPVFSESSDLWLARFSKAVEHSLEGFVPSFPNGRPPSNTFGRGQRTQPQTNSSPQLSVRPSRPGEEALRHDGLGAEVRRWFQQLRRLQSLHHAVNAGNPSAGAVSYRLSLWRSILQARGFRHGFANWWCTRPVRLANSPGTLPVTLPTASLAQLLYEDFRANFRRLEDWHLRNRTKVLDAKYDRSLAQIYQDLRAPGPEQVTTLQVSREYAILAVEGQQVHLDRPLDLRGTSSWAIDGEPTSIQSSEDDLCTLTTPASLSGQELEQVQTLSSVADLCFEFKSLWAPRWQLHSAATPPDWQRFMDFVIAFLPQHRIELPDITPEVWTQAIHRFKPRAARGPDGWARADLLNLPRSRTTELINFLSEVEAAQRPWPRQMIVGFVCLLCKGNGRTDCQGYGPICLYSIIYRAWAGIRARQALAALRSLLPTDLFGFIPGHEAMELPKRGSTSRPITDIIKCFNHLPRAPLFMLARHVGLPPCLLKPWAAFLSATERRFHIRGQVGEGILSSSGFPEGCPLSPLAMVLADWSYHEYMRAFAPSARSLSYVDNLTCTSQSVAALIRAYGVMSCFTDLLGLPLDATKTYVWATKGADRAALKCLGHPVVEAARELGGIMSFGPRIRNAAMKDRCAALGPLWAALRRSQTPGCLKLQTLPGKFWAQALHGISGCPFPEAQLSRLRSAATAALGIRPGGVSSMLRLSIAEPSTADPGFYQLWTCARDFRRMAGKLPNFVLQWRTFMDSFDGRTTHGPFTKLVTVFAQVGWSIQHPPWILDHEGLEHNFLTVPLVLLRRLLEHAWLQFVARSHNHRQGMSDLKGLDPGLLKADQKQLSALNSARYASVRAGAFLFGHMHSHYDLTKDGLCSRCRVPDTVEHRCRSCPHYSHLRVEHQWAVDQWDSLPVSLTHHLLPSANPHLVTLRSLLHRAVDTTGVFFCSGFGDGWQHLFTDGACIENFDPEFSLAGWGLVHAQHHAAVACGVLPGILQSAPRAEICAMTAAARWAIGTGLPCIVWTDAQNVSTGVAALQAGLPLDRDADTDLWQTLEGLLVQLDPTRFLVRHTPSHLDEQLTESPYEDWLAGFNGHADVLAGLAARNRPEMLMTAYLAARSYHSEQVRLLRAFRAIFFGIADIDQGRGRQQVPADDDTWEPQVPAPFAVPRRLDIEGQLPLNWRDQLPLACDLPSDFVGGICNFLFEQDAQATAAYELSWLELVFALHLEGAVVYPVCDSSGKWVSATSRLLQPPAPTVAGRLSLVRRAMRPVLRRLGLQSSMISGIDRSDFGLGFALDGLIIGFSTDLFLRARATLGHFVQGRAAGTRAALARPL